jgi:hypothetical protein
MERAWKTVEVALHGGAWLRQISANADDQPLADQLGKLIIETEAALALRESQRRLALPDLASARRKNVLAMPPSVDAAMATGLAGGAALYTRFDDFELLMNADRSAVQQIGNELRQGGFGHLGEILLADDAPLIITAVRYYFRRAVQENDKLSNELAFARFEELLPELQDAFDAVNDVITNRGRRLEELLGNVASAAQETKTASLDLKTEAEQIGAHHAELYKQTSELLRRFDLTHASVQPGDERRIRNEQERQQIKYVAQQYQQLPGHDRQQLLALRNAIGRLELAAGDVENALRQFQTVAAGFADPAGKGEAHMNAYHAALALSDFTTAMKEYLEAIKLDGRRFATFPVGKYIPSMILGTGGFGTAFLCKHKYMNTNVVVKALSTDGLERDVNEVFAEAQALGQLNHSAIIRVQDCGYVDAGRKHRPFLVMDYFDAPTLREHVEKHGPMTADELVALAEPVAAGLHAAHARGILHRDIKPDNILVKRLADANGKPRWEAKVIDFGLALRQQAVHSGQGSSKLAAAAGTVEYASPEQLGRLPGVAVGARSDVYSFAKTCCFALFRTTAPLMKHWTSIPKPIAEVLERCLSERPEDRPKDMAIVNRCFARALADGQIPVVGVSEVPATPATSLQTVPVARASRRSDRRDDDDDRDFRPARRRGGNGVLIGVLAGVALLALVGCCGGGAAIYYLAQDETESSDKSEVVQGGGQPNNAGGAAGGNNSNRPAGGDPGKGGGKAGGGGVDFGGGPRPEQKKRNVTFAGSPNADVADFVTDRVKASENANRAPTLVSVSKNGNDVAAVIEDKFGSDIDGWLRSLDLGAVDGDGDDYKVTLTTPPEPKRKPADRVELPKFSPQQFQAIVLAVNTKRNEHDAIRQLKNHSPRDEQRPAARNILRAFVKDPFVGADAIEALGMWGTPEDVPFLLGLDDGGPFGNKPVIHALEFMRDPAGASYLAGKLDNFFVGEDCFKALRAIGPGAEKDLLLALNKNNRESQVRICKLLKEFGSTDSTTALKAAGRSNDGEVAKAAWDALKVIAFFPAKGVSRDKGAVASKAKTTVNVDDLKVTTLDDSASGLVANIALAADGHGFYTVEPASVITRRDWNGDVVASSPAGGMKLMAIARDGVLLANNQDLKLLDAKTLDGKNSGPVVNARWLTSSPEIDFAIARLEGQVSGILVIDVGSFTISTTYADAKSGKAIVLPAGIGKSDPVLTPDGRLLFTQGEGRLQRWSVASYKLTASDSTKVGNGDGKIVVSPDGKYVALLLREAISTPIFAVNDLKKPAFTINHGAMPTALVFDAKGGVSVATETTSLIRFDATGKRLKDYDLGGATRQIVADADGKRLIVLTKDKLMNVELP